MILEMIRFSHTLFALPFALLAAVMAWTVRANQDPPVPWRWQELLGIGLIGIKDSFFDLGGHSLQGTRLIGRVEKELGKTFSLATLFQSPTIEELAQELRKKRRLPGLPLLVPFRTRGTQTPIFLHGGSLELSRHLGEDRPCYGLEPHGQDGGRAPETVEEMGADYLRQVRSVQPQGPYLVGGFSFGGLVAFEMARQLRQSGQQVGLLILIDPTPPNFSNAGTREVSSIGSESGDHGVVGRHWRNLRQQDPGRWVSYLLAGMKWRRQYYARALKMLLCCAYFRIGRRIPSGLRMFYFFETSEKATAKYMPSPYDGPVVLLQSQSSAAGSLSVWREFISGDLKIHELPGDHLDAIIGPQVEVWGSLMKQSLV
jgi:thioesterase domain-containing protein/acyl carrier protein